MANCSILRAVCYQNIVAQGFHQHPNRIKGNYKYTFVPPSTFISHHNCQKRKHNRHSNIDVGRKTNNRCYSKLPNHEQRYTDHRQIPFSLTSKKYIEIKKNKYTAQRQSNISIPHINTLFVHIKRILHRTILFTNYLSPVFTD